MIVGIGSLKGKERRRKKEACGKDTFFISRYIRLEGEKLALGQRKESRQSGLHHISFGATVTITTIRQSFWIVRMYICKSPPSIYRHRWAHYPVGHSMYFG